MQAILPTLYFLLVLVAGVVTYSLLADLVHSMNHPVRSIRYFTENQHPAPGIAIYPGGAKFLACGHYFQNVVTSKIRLSQLNLKNRNCSYVDLRYDDPHNPNVEREALVIRGPTDVVERESAFIHFELSDPTRDFFTVSYFLFPNWDQFNDSSNEERVTNIAHWHRFVPTFALSAGFRFWIKMSLKETYFENDDKNVEFRTEYSVVRHWDQREDNERNKTHLFFIFFEWKNNIVEQSFLLYTTSPWSIGAGLCGVFLMLHKACQLLKAFIRRIKRDKAKRKAMKQGIVLERVPDDR